MEPERFGSYLVYEQIGKGGMATVHRAERATKRGVQEVALKRLVPTTKRELVALFLDEARLMKYLEHPNIAVACDSGKVFGRYFIAMEHVRGPNLREILDHCRATVGSMPEAITLNVIAQICEALDHAHSRTDEQGASLGIVHRDVTPANVIISETGLVKLIDFGLAKAKGTREQTGVGIIKGKYGYVAPEYIAGKLDHRADIWAVGIIMYELLTSRRLFEGHDAFETMRRVREMPIPRPSIANPAVTPEMDEIVMTALERDLSRRWPSAAAMRDRIRAVIAQPGNALDNQAVIDWVRWALAQKPGRAPQLTPILAMPVQRDPDANAERADPAEAVRLPSFAAIAWTLPNIVWAGCAIALALLLLGAVVWKLLG